MPTIPYKQALLIKRMAWVNMQQCDKPHIPTPTEIATVPKIVRMLFLVACLDNFVIDMQESFDSCGILRGAVKRWTNLCFERVANAHGAAYRMLAEIEPETARKYNSYSEAFIKQINDSVLLEEPERSYNIVVAICRIIERENRSFGRNDFVPAKELYSIPNVLRCCKLEDHQLDSLIDITTKS